LFTTEFFQLAKSKLQPDGVMCQWIQLYEIHHSHFQTILRTYLDVFPNVQLFRVNHDAVLVGSLQPGKINLEELERRMTPRLQADLDRLRIHSIEELLACHWIGGDELRRAVVGGGFNTDDNLFIEFEAPLKVMRRQNEAQDYNEMLNLFLERSTALVPNLELPAGMDAAAFWARMADACLRQPHPFRAKLYAEHSLRLKPNALAARISKAAKLVAGFEVTAIADRNNITAGGEFHVTAHARCRSPSGSLGAVIRCRSSRHEPPCRVRFRAGDSSAVSRSCLRVPALRRRLPRVRVIIRRVRSISSSPIPSAARAIFSRG
jgi:hypothetical protein